MVNTPGGAVGAASDEALLAAIAARDAAAFAAFYDRHNLLAYHLARKLLGGDREAAADVAQEVFLAVWRRAGTFDPARGAARTWLLSSVHHAAVGRTRGRWAHERRAAPLGPALGLAAPAPDDPAAAAEAAERAALVRGALATLPAPQREALALHYGAGLTCDALAARTGVPPGTARGRLRLGRERLRLALAPLAAE